MRIEITPGWHDALDAELLPRMDRMVDDIADDAARYAPYDTGLLESHIDARRVDDTLWRVHSHAPYTLWVEYPTRAHEIKARRPGGFLVWTDPISGAKFAAKRVWHPGTTAQPFLRPALFQVRAL